MTWSSIATGSGWHGPCYVHVLDRPFRLYQLSEFSVTGELRQSYHTMGKTYVALYDENMQRVMMILFGDSWYSSSKGYFNVYFYPQGGSSSYRSSGYIYSSFRKTGRLWWDEYDGSPQGAIFASIDGQGSSYPLASVINASRVIKYVAILGYRAYSYPLVEMRVHDIRVVADLNRHNPNAQDPDEPVAYDGTAGAQNDCAGAEAARYSDEVQNDVETYWTGPWPEVHVVAHRVDSDESQFHIHVKSDLLGNWEIVELSANTFGLQALSDSEYEALQDDTAETIDSIWDETLFYAALAMQISWLALAVAGTLVWFGASTWYFIIALAVWVGTFTAYVLLLYQSFVERGMFGFAYARRFLLSIIGLVANIVASMRGLLGLGVKDPLKLRRYWSRYGFRRMTKSGPKGRVASGVLVASMFLLVLTALLASLIYIGGN